MTDPDHRSDLPSGPVALRLALDAAACQGRGICVLRCPDRIALDLWGFPVVDPEPLTFARDLARARRAVAACPEGALSLERPDGPRGLDEREGPRGLGRRPSGDEPARGREPPGAPATKEDGHDELAPAEHDDDRRW